MPFILPHVMFRGLPVILAALCLSLASCQKESQVDKATREGILLVGNVNEPKSLDPQVCTGVIEANLTRALFETLITSDAVSDSATPPGAALSVTPNATATVWTIKLRPDGKWSDGTPVTAHDYAFSYERILSPNFGAKYSDMLYFMKGAKEFNHGETTDFSTVGIEVLDDDTFRLTLRGPTPYFGQILKHYTWCAVPSHVVRKFGTMDQIGNPWSKGANLVGNGPFRLKSWRRNDHIEVERNPYYWDAANVTLNGIRFLPITNLYTEARMFRDGQLHTTYGAPPEMVDLMKREHPEEVREEPYLGTSFFRFNVTRKPMDDIRVRQAICFAVDRAAICSTVFRGFRPAYAMTPPMGGYQPPMGQKYDPEKGRRLLAEAGYPQGKGFPRLKVLLASRGEGGATLTQAVQAMLRENLGVDIEIETKEWTAYLDAQQKLEFDISYAGWVGDYLDPLTFLEMWMPNNGNNNTGWSNPQFVDLLGQSFSEADGSKRFAQLQQAEAIFVNESPVLLIAWQARNYLQHPSVQGWHPLLLSDNPYEHLKLVPRH